jgi:glycosyltransferase involved in cell wall biosynthesis
MNLFSSKSILYIQYTNPAAYPPLQHSSRILAAANWQVIFLGSGVDIAENLSFPIHPNVKVYQIPSCPPGWRQKLHYFQYSLWIFLSVLRWRPQWIYASDLLSCPIAYGISFIPKIKLIYHEHDVFYNERGDSPFIKLCLKIRKSLVKRSNLCIIPNQDRLNQFLIHNPTNSLVVCIWNCPAIEEVSPQRLPWNISDDLWVLYHGSIVPDRLPLAVIDSLSILPENVKLRIIGYETIGHEGYVNQIINYARNLGVLSRLQVMDAMSRIKLLEWCKKSDVGLSLMPLTGKDINLISMIGASNKPFDYLACGIPLIVSDLPDWHKMYVHEGYGLACNPQDEQTIATAIRWYLENPVQMRAMGEQGRQRILSDWNYDKQFKQVGKQIIENYDCLELTD